MQIPTEPYRPSPALLTDRCQLTPVVEFGPRREGARLADARPVDARPVDARPVDARPVHSRPVHARPVHARLMDARPVRARPVDARLAARFHLPRSPRVHLDVEHLDSKASRLSHPNRR